MRIFQVPLHPMAFPCFVCGKLFNRPQDRSGHIRLKKDEDHKQYFHEQQQSVIQKFSDTVDAAATAIANTLPDSHPIIDDAFAQWDDGDNDNLPSTWNMDIDTLESGTFSDEEQSIISSVEVPIVEGGDDDEGLQQIEATMAAASSALGGVNLDDIPDAFNFLPDPEVDMAEAGPSTGYQGTRRTLIGIDAEQPTFKWHQSAGQVYGEEPIIHARWQSLFHSGSDSEAYKPFRSRLDWEIAQWAVKEKISQKSFNRLLNIPQVICSLFAGLATRLNVI